MELAVGRRGRRRGRGGHPPATAAAAASSAEQAGATASDSVVTTTETSAAVAAAEEPGSLATSRCGGSRLRRSSHLPMSLSAGRTTSWIGFLPGPTAMCGTWR